MAKTQLKQFLIALQQRAPYTIAGSVPMSNTVSQKYVYSQRQNMCRGQPAVMQFAAAAPISSSSIATTLLSWI